MLMVEEVLGRLGGIATRADLRQATSRADLDAALGAGTVVAVGRSQIRLGQASHELALARSHAGVLAGDSAALHWGWKVKTARRLPVVLVARNNARRTSTVQLVRRDVPADWIDGDALSRVATVVDCALRLPMDAALAVVDSALRPWIDERGHERRGLGRGELLDAVPALGGRRHARVRRVIDLADGRAANPFESVTRAIALGVEGLELVPQVQVAGHGHADLGDERLRIAVECVSWTWHSDQDAFRKDMRRYARMTASGWILLPFVWEDVMRRPAWVRARLEEAVAMARHARLHTFRSGGG